MHPTSSLGELLAHMCIVAWKSLLLTSYLSYDLLSPMIVLIDVSLSHLFVFLLHLLSVSPFRCQLFLLMLIHCMSAQNIEREWISLTCTWLVVWGRVQIRIQM